MYILGKPFPNRSLFIRFIDLLKVVLFTFIIDFQYFEVYQQSFWNQNFTCRLITVISNADRPDNMSAIAQSSGELIWKALHNFCKKLHYLHVLS